MTNCFHCGDDDHLARDCPLNKKPPQSSPVRGAPATWCGYCDENTRQVDLGHSVQRCPNCHPLRFHQLKHSRKCPQCNKTVYDWDHGPCDEHSGPGLPVPRPAKKGRPESTRIKAAEAEPAASYPSCYRSPLGIMVHGPGCKCP